MPYPDPKNVPALIVTRGDVPLHDIALPLVANLGPLLVWDNTFSAVDLRTFGLYALMNGLPPTAIVYVQDDDVTVSRPQDVVAAWTPGRIVCNMGADYRGQYVGRRPDRLMGFGSVFEVSLVRRTMDEYFSHFTPDPLMFREMNRIFTGLNTDLIDLVDVPIEHAPWASAPNRLWKQAKEHAAMRDEAYRRIAVIRAARAQAQSEVSL